LDRYRYRDAAPHIREPPAGDLDPFPIRPNPAGSERESKGARETRGEAGGLKGSRGPLLQVVFGIIFGPRLPRGEKERERERERERESEKENENEDEREREREREEARREGGREREAEEEKGREGETEYCSRSRVLTNCGTGATYLLFTT